MSPLPARRCCWPRHMGRSSGSPRGAISMATMRRASPQRSVRAGRPGCSRKRRGRSSRSSPGPGTVMTSAGTAFGVAPGVDPAERECARPGVRSGVWCHRAALAEPAAEPAAGPAAEPAVGPAVGPAAPTPRRGPAVAPCRAPHFDATPRCPSRRSRGSAPEPGAAPSRPTPPRSGLSRRCTEMRSKGRCLQIRSKGPLRPDTEQGAAASRYGAGGCCV